MSRFAMHTADWVALPFLALAYLVIWLKRRAILDLFTEWAVPDKALRWDWLTNDGVNFVMPWNMPSWEAYPLSFEKPPPWALKRGRG